MCPVYQYQQDMLIFRFPHSSLGAIWLLFTTSAAKFLTIWLAVFVTWPCFVFFCILWFSWDITPCTWLCLHSCHWSQICGSMTNILTAVLTPSQARPASGQTGSLSCCSVLFRWRRRCSSGPLRGGTMRSQGVQGVNIIYHNSTPQRLIQGLFSFLMKA